MSSKKIKNTDYCCLLTGHGHFYATDDLLNHNENEIPTWISNQGEISISGLEWDLIIGIAHNDEEWRQHNDLKQFLLEAFEYLEYLLENGRGGFTVAISYSKSDSVSFGLSARTLGLLSALNIRLEVMTAEHPKIIDRCSA